MGTRLIVEKTEKKPISVQALAESVNDYFCYRLKVSEGTKGPIEYEFSKRRVTLSRDGQPHKSVWLVTKRTIEESPTYSYYISNAPVSCYYRDKMDPFGRYVCCLLYTSPSPRD